MIDDESVAKIKQLFYADHFTVHAISKSLSIHHSAISRILNFKQNSTQQKRFVFTVLDPYKQHIDEKLDLYSKLPATRLMQILQDRGYKGSITTLRNYLRVIRPQKVKAYMRMTVHPGEQGQVDWAHAGEMKVGGAIRKLYIFVMVLSYSRAVYAEFTLNMHTSTFFRCHERAFEYFDGIPRILLYDNLKSVVLQRRGSKVRYNSDAIEFSGFYHYEPRPCNIRRGNEKGRVERTIRYIRDNFLAARTLGDLKTANEAILKWCNTIANKRPWPDNRQYLVESMWKKEKANLLKLSGRWLRPKEQRPAVVRKTPWLIFDLNSYSIPPDFVGKPLIISADDKVVQIFSEDKLIAEHVRSFDRERFIEHKDHRIKMLEYQQFGRNNLFRENIVKDFPACEVILAKQFSDGHDTATVVRNLYQLRYTFGDNAFANGLKQSIKQKRYTIESIRYLLTKIESDSRLQPHSKLSLPDRKDVKSLEITSNPLSNYDEI